ncbi:MAG: hypothetical protein JWN68_3281 [Nocardioides sp.]|jgi:uncharacterized protein YdeI (YjbR/CyaY-like superfamily)|uniref:YdeI/OmpD-associated family protein n=1 Tax=Nocardioides sp. TaxID=35761 RepID=UPI002618BFD9|nr:YdeI/OmpD-associated family protein [Nocardioides sp.]MCW2835328.1 hypothetical protein [Nocardioides sp.]
MVGTPGGTPDRPATFFASAEKFRAWLEANHETATELWMGLRKKHVADRGLTWADAVPEALCFGWIDSVAQRIDEDSVRQRWTPRKSTSIWSAVNIARVERLVAEGRMLPAGLAAYEKRTPERSGIYAYESGRKLSDEQRARLLADPAAAAFWEVATPSYRTVAEDWVVSAKREQTRESRLVQLIEDSAAGRLIPSQRYGDEPKWVARAAAAARAAT